MCDKKGSHSKSDLEGHNMQLVMMPFDRPHTISYYIVVFHCNYVSIVHRFRDIMMYFPKFTRSRDSEHILFGGNLSRAHLVHLRVNQYTAFAVPSFTDSKDMIGGQNLRKRVR